MKKLDIRKDLYNCCPLLNKECTKENCYINDGPCRLTCDYNQSQEYLIEKTKLFHKNGVFSLEYDKETLRDMVLEYQEKIDKAIKYIEERKIVLEEIAVGDDGTYSTAKATYDNSLKILLGSEIEQDLKHREEAEKEIERLNNIIKELEKELDRAYLDLFEYELVNGREFITNIKNYIQELKGEDKE